MEVLQRAHIKLVTARASTKLPQLDEVPGGNIILIRFVRSNRLLDILGEKFRVSKNLVYSYAEVVVVTKIHRLQMYPQVVFQKSCKIP